MPCTLPSKKWQTIQRRCPCNSFRSLWRTQHWFLPVLRWEVLSQWEPTLSVTPIRLLSRRHWAAAGIGFCFKKPTKVSFCGACSKTKSSVQFIIKHNYQKSLSNWSSNPLSYCIRKLKIEEATPKKGTETIFFSTQLYAYRSATLYVFLCCCW